MREAVIVIEEAVKRTGIEDDCETVNGKGFTN